MRAPEGLSFLFLVITFFLILASGLRFFAALYTGALVIFLLTQILLNASLCAIALKSFQSVVQRFVLSDNDFRHLVSLPPKSHFCVSRAINGSMALTLTL